MHNWFRLMGLTVCKSCGVVKRADGDNGPCPGKIRVALRENRIRGGMMSKAGRKRKLNADRNRDGTIKRQCLNDKGNDRVQERRDRFACFRDGKAHEHLGD